MPREYTPHPRDRSLPTVERFIRRISFSDDGCWEWIGSTFASGYGRFHCDGRVVMAHRWSYEYFRGAIAEELEIDHLCRNRGCVNPDHIEPVTTTENIRRMFSYRRAFRQLPGHCVKGHEQSGDNVGWRKDGGRYCRVCQREYAREYMRKKRQALTRT